MSRGLSHDAAERLIVDGFFEPVMQRISLESVRTQHAAVDRSQTSDVTVRKSQRVYYDRWYY